MAKDSKYLDAIEPAEMIKHSCSLFKMKERFCIHHSQCGADDVSLVNSAQTG